MRIVFSKEQAASNGARAAQSRLNSSVHAARVHAEKQAKSLEKSHNPQEREMMVRMRERAQVLMAVEEAIGGNFIELDLYR